MHSERPREDFVFLDNSRNSEHGFGFGRNQLLFENPRNCLTLHRFDEVESFFAEVDRLAATHWLAGYFSYELGHYFTTGLRIETDEPLAWLGVFDEPRAVEPGFLDGAAPFSMDEGSFSQSRDEYRAAIAAIHEAIRSGLTYQVNYCLAHLFSLTGDPWGLYSFMRAQQPVSHGAVLQGAGQWAISASPELFFRRDGDAILSKPMKGTAARGRTTAEDRAIAAWLQSDEKSRAENAMIVDLLRNDIGALSQLGTVEARDIFRVERYPTLFQMISSVEGRLGEGTSWREIFGRLFPCGSITGAPKIFTMQIIERLESQPRGIYTGTIGYIHGQRAEFSVPIRTVQLRETDSGSFDARLGLGSGIVMDSVAEDEYEECLLKAQFLHRVQQEFQLLETMRCEDGQLRDFEKHMQRARDSADYFNWQLDWQSIAAEIAAQTEKLEGLQRVRVLLARDGAVELQSFPFTDGEPDERLEIAISSEVIDADDPFHFHKTTKRSCYDEAFAAAHAAGLADIIFCNRDGYLTQGAISNIFIKRDGELLTPPQEMGLLAGIARRKLLEEGAKEALLRPADLRSADEIYLSNSLRGLRRVYLRR